jgi:hypothetical protein
MISQMNQVQNAARLAMADHRAARSRVTRRSHPTSWRTRAFFVTGVLVIAVAAFFTLPGAF